MQGPAEGCLCLVRFVWYTLPSSPLLPHCHLPHPLAILQVRKSAVPAATIPTHPPGNTDPVELSTSHSQGQHTTG